MNCELKIIDKTLKYFKYIITSLLILGLTSCGDATANSSNNSAFALQQLDPTYSISELYNGVLPIIPTSIPEVIPGKEYMVFSDQVVHQRDDKINAQISRLNQLGIHVYVRESTEKIRSILDGQNISYTSLSEDDLVSATNLLAFTANFLEVIKYHFKQINLDKIGIVTVNSGNNPDIQIRAITDVDDNFVQLNSTMFNLSAEEVYAMWYHELGHILFTNDSELENVFNSLSSSDYSKSDTECFERLRGSIDYNGNMVVRAGFVSAYASCKVKEDIPEVFFYLIDVNKQAILKSVLRATNCDQILQRKIYAIMDRLNNITTDIHFTDPQNYMRALCFN